MHSLKINTNVPCQKEFHTFSVLMEKSESSCGEEKHHILESCLGRTLIRQDKQNWVSFNLKSRIFLKILYNT